MNNQLITSQTFFSTTERHFYTQQMGKIDVSCETFWNLHNATNFLLQVKENGLVDAHQAMELLQTNPQDLKIGFWVQVNGLHYEQVIDVNKHLMRHASGRCILTGND